MRLLDCFFVFVFPMHNQIVKMSWHRLSHDWLSSQCNINNGPGDVSTDLSGTEMNKAQHVFRAISSDAREQGCHERVSHRICGSPDAKIATRFGVTFAP